MKFDAVVIGIVVALLSDQAIESLFGARAAKIYLALLVAGAVMYNRAAIQRAISQIQVRL